VDTCRLAYLNLTTPSQPTFVRCPHGALSLSGLLKRILPAITDYMLTTAPAGADPKSWRYWKHVCVRTQQNSAKTRL